MKDWPVDEWTGCYPSMWKGMVVPEAITHPAKFSSRLIRRIYDHMIAEGWLKAGDIVLDPFGGVALGALDAMRLGLHWRGIELEARFADLGNQNIRLWNGKFSRMPGWCRDAVLVQGDSRHLIEVLQGGDASVSSPPYTGDALGHGESQIDTSKSKHDFGPNSQAKSPMSYGGAVGSPPYANSVHEGSDDQHPERMEGTAINFPGLDAGIASPPYAGSMGNAEHSGIDWSKQQDRDTAHPHGWNGQGYSQAAIGSPPYSEARIGQESGQEHAGRGDQYGPTPGQLGAMPAEGLDAALASPPFRQQSGGAHFPKGMEITDPGLISRHSAGNQASHGYGETDGQLANMAEGEIEAALSSPPYEATEVAHFEVGGTDIEGRKALRASGEWEGYNRENPDNLGSSAGEDFWMAARQIVDQVYAVLRPGGHAVWVVKGFVKNKQLVDFPGQWRQLCEAAGFTMVHEHHAMLIHDKGTSHTLDGGTVHHQTESKSFFRRLAESKGAPRIDFETVLCMVKGVE